MKRFKKSVLGVLAMLMFFAAPLTGVYAAGEKDEESEGENPNQLIIINKSINKLAFFDKGHLVKVYPVATGRQESFTPVGDYKVIVKAKNVPYYKLNIPGGAPNNPLGPRWIGINVPGTAGYTYGMHGNASPWSIGTYASDGCVRMYNDDVTELYDMVEVGADVSILHSEKDFASIAEEKGHEVVHAEDYEGDFKLSSTTKVYSFPNKGSIIEKHEFKSGNYPIQKKLDFWFEIQVGEEMVWVNTTDSLMGEYESEKGYFKLGTNAQIFETPKVGGKRMKFENEYYVTNLIKHDKWSFVRTVGGVGGWVENTKLTQVDEKDYNTQMSSVPLWNGMVDFLDTTIANVQPLSNIHG